MRQRWDQFDEKRGLIAAINAIPEAKRRRLVSLNWHAERQLLPVVAGFRDGETLGWDGEQWVEIRESFG